MKLDRNEQNRAGWQRVARTYAGDEAAEDDPVMRRRVRARFMERLPQGAKVLEVGCGPGTDSAAFASEGFAVTATDYAPEFIDVVRERYPELDARVMDMTAPDLPCRSFEGIYGFASFLHLPRELAQGTIGQLAELLLPGGLLCLTLIKSSKGVREYAIDGWVGDPETSMLFTCYDEAEATKLAEQAGLEQVELLPVESDVYAQIPRLVERGIESYQLLARRPNV